MSRLCTTQRGSDGVAATPVNCTLAFLQQTTQHITDIVWLFNLPGTTGCRHTGGYNNNNDTVVEFPQLLNTNANRKTETQIISYLVKVFITI